MPLEFVISSWIKIIPAINTITTPAKATIAANRSRRSLFACVFIPLSSIIFEDISASYPLTLEEKSRLKLFSLTLTMELIALGGGRLKTSADIVLAIFWQY